MPLLTPRGNREIHGDDARPLDLPPPIPRSIDPIFALSIDPRLNHRILEQIILNQIQVVDLASDFTQRRTTCRRYPIRHPPLNLDATSICYYGTRRENFERILENGFPNKIEDHGQYGPGVLTTPDIGVAEIYAHLFFHMGVGYAAVFEIRVLRDRVRELGSSTGKNYFHSLTADLTPTAVLIIKKT